MQSPVSLHLFSYIDHPLVACVLMLLLHLNTIIVYLVYFCGSADKCSRYPLSGAAWPWEWRHSLQVSSCCFLTFLQCYNALTHTDTVEMCLYSGNFKGKKFACVIVLDFFMVTLLNGVLW